MDNLKRFNITSESFSTGMIAILMATNHSHAAWQFAEKYFRMFNNELPVSILVSDNSDKPYEKYIAFLGNKEEITVKKYQT